MKGFAEFYFFECGACRFSSVQAVAYDNFYCLNCLFDLGKFVVMDRRPALVCDLPEGYDARRPVALRR